MLVTTNADAPLPVGSLMKLLNAVVAYDAGQQDRQVVAPGGLAGGDGESVIGIGAGQVVSRSSLIRAMLKVSANDAARLLAMDIAGSEDAYATMMNDAASSLGLTNTHAVNATGLDAAGQFSSARDLITLATDLSANAEFRRTVMEPTARFDGRTIPSTNDLLGTYPGADGIKTGHTSDAGYCLLASATRDGRRIIVAVLGVRDRRRPRPGCGHAARLGVHRGPAPGMTSRRRRNAAALVRFWQAVEQNRRLGVLGRVEEHPVAVCAGAAAEALGVTVPEMARANPAQIDVHIGTSAASSGWWCSRQRPSSWARWGCRVVGEQVVEASGGGVDVAIVEVVEHRPQAAGEHQERRDIVGTERGQRRGSPASAVARRDSRVARVGRPTGCVLSSATALTRSTAARTPAWSSTPANSLDQSWAVPYDRHW